MQSWFEGRVVAKLACDRPVLAAAAALLLLFAGNADATAGAAPDREEARFEVYGFAGLHVLTNRTAVERSGDQYAIATDLDTRGLASVFVDLKSHSQVSGRLGNGAPRPETYRADVLRNGAERHYAVDFGRDGTVTDAGAPVQLASLPRANEMRGAVDQLTAYFLLEQQLASRDTCTLVVPVFDGSARYDLRSTDRGREMLAAERHQNFAGGSRLCEVTRENLATSPDRNEDTYRRGKIWYAPLIAGEMTPVRMEFATDSGVVTAYLTALSAPGVDLHLTRE
jgi:Protein of unknown function (DUF3108)